MRRGKCFYFCIASTASVCLFTIDSTKTCWKVVVADTSYFTSFMWFSVSVIYICQNAERRASTQRVIVEGWERTGVQPDRAKMPGEFWGLIGIPRDSGSRLRIARCIYGLSVDSRKIAIVWSCFHVILSNLRMIN